MVILTNGLKTLKNMDKVLSSNLFLPFSVNMSTRHYS